VICPKYFPIADGLGHYTTEFCRHLAERAEVAIWTSRDRGRVEKASGHPPGQVTLIDTVKRWTWGGPFASVRRALDFGPDKILVEFVPFMYTPRGGINFSLVFLAWFLAARARVVGRGRVQVMFHELWYPFAWRPKDALLHLAHRCMVFGVGVASEDVFCSTPYGVDVVRRRLWPFQRETHLLPVASSLERDGASAPSPRPPDDVLRLAIFGSLHAGKNASLVFEAVREASRASPWKLELTIIGPTREELYAEFPEWGAWLDDTARVAGPLDSDEAADCLASQDFLVAYFQDGVSTRRTTLMAAFCEGLPAVTTWGVMSDETFRNRPFLKLLPCEGSPFVRELVALLTSSERPFAGVSRDDVRSFYRQRFSWSSIIRRYMELSRLAPRTGPVSP
jgi:glycosyltransferase involved in cell wall biosynthesis